MKKWLLACGMLLLLFGALANAQTPETFSQFITTLPLATTPLGAGDQLYVLQGGTSKKVQSLSLSCSPPTSAQIGCVKPDGVTIGATAGGVITTIGGGGGGSGTNLGWVVATAAPFSATGDGTTDDTAAIQAAIDFAAVNGIQTVYLPKASNCYKTTGPLYLDPPGNLRANLNNPNRFNFSLNLMGEPGGPNQEDSFGAHICPSNNNFVALWVGPGQGMRVSHLSILSPGGVQAGAIRCGQPGTGTGVAIAGGSAGASRTVIEDVMVTNFYYGFTTGQNSNGLAEQNAFHRIFTTNSCIGLWVRQTQNFINSCIECSINGSTTGALVQDAQGLTVVGGNWSSVNSLSEGVTTLSAISAPTFSGVVSFAATLGAPAFSNVTSYGYGDIVASGGQLWFCLNFSPACTGTTPSLGVPSAWEPFGDFIGIFNSWAIVTTHYGVIPLTVTSYTQATGAIAFSTTTAWQFASYGNVNPLTQSDLGTEIQAVSAVYAAENLTTWAGVGISVTGVHVENHGPTTLMHSFSTTAGASNNFLQNVRLNFDPTQVGSISGNAASKARFYIQQSFPFIWVDNVNLDIRDSAFDVFPTDNPIIVDVSLLTLGELKLDANSTNFSPMALRAYSNGGCTNGYNGVGSTCLGTGRFERSPFIPNNLGNPGGGLTTDGYKWVTTQWGRSPFVGYRPDSNYTPCILPSQLATLSGALPAVINNYPSYIQFGYPFLFGGQNYALCDWSLGAQTNYVFQSTHQYYSLGQNLTTTNIPTLSWNYKGQSFVVNADVQTLFTVFPGLGVTLNDGSADHKYIITGVYPALGYFTVQGTDISSGGFLSGVKGSTVTGTLIKQQPYSIVFH